MTNTLKFLCCYLFATSLFAQNFSLKNITINTHVDGTLMTPNDNNDAPLVIFIGGSGPVDRDGNQSFMKNNMLKKLAEALIENRIASFRYDKRIVKQIRTNTVDMSISFDDFVSDAKSVISYFEPDYKTIVVAGHSQGSLVGILALGKEVSGYISLAGAGDSIDQVILDQISKTAPMFLDDSKRVLEQLKQGKTTEDYPVALASIFSLDIQPFMSNWMQYNPAEALKSHQLPVLIINGDKDLQVHVDEANLLYEAAQNAELLIVENMNHILVKIEGDELENMKSYNDSSLEIAQDVEKSIVSFIRNLK
jgi:fermentation-respiration switch protein FrsA (DUF1100 family)